MESVFGTLRVATGIAGYFGLVDSVSVDVKKLVHQAFLSAKDNLEYALNATGENQWDYIKRAQGKFIEAINVEENENKVLSLTGLAFCQYLLSDGENAKRTIKRIDAVRLTRSRKVKDAVNESVLGEVINYGTAFVIIRDPIPVLPPSPITAFGRIGFNIVRAWNRGAAEKDFVIFKQKCVRWWEDMRLQVVSHD